MVGRSPYSVLGLEPGAGPVAIEAAYRRLIKRHHPDRVGGDPARAAEINEAYQNLRKQFGDRLGQRRGPPVPVHELPSRRPRKIRWWILLVSLLAMTMIANRDVIRDAFDQFGAAGIGSMATGPLAADGPPRSARIADLESVPLDSDGIDRSVRDAVTLAGTYRGVDQLAERSRTCHRRFRSKPSTSSFDRCVAFDETASRMTETDLLDQRGPFGFSAMAARQLNSGKLLSENSMDIESRLARIRLQVELALAPPEPSFVRHVGATGREGESDY